MSKIDDLISDIKTQKIGNSNKRVLLLEGIDDCDALSIFLTKKFPAWEQKWALAEAGNKKQVLAVLAKVDDWLGLVDRDEWTAAEIGIQTARLQNLVILPRFCLESYLVEPNELWSALPAKQRDKMAGGLAELIEKISSEKQTWLRHAALWHVINPLWGRLRALGFNNEVLKPDSVPDDNELRIIFSRWHNAIDFEQTLQAVNALIAQFQNESDFEFYTQHLYAKQFYPSVIHKALNNLLGQKDAKIRRQAIFRHLAIPTDLNVLWEKMELLG